MALLYSAEDLFKLAGRRFRRAATDANFVAYFWQAMNETLDDLATRMTMPFARTEGTISLAADTGVYDMPADMWTPERESFYEEDQQQPVTLILEADARSRGLHVDTTSGTPTKIWQNADGQWQVWPIPADGQDGDSLTFVYYGLHQPFQAQGGGTGQALALPRTFGEALRTGVFWRVAINLEIDSNLVQEMERVYEKSARAAVGADQRRRIKRLRPAQGVVDWTGRRGMLAVQEETDA